MERVRVEFSRRESFTFNIYKEDYPEYFEGYKFLKDEVFKDLKEGRLTLEDFDDAFDEHDHYRERLNIIDD